MAEEEEKPDVVGPVAALLKSESEGDKVKGAEELRALAEDPG